MKITRLAVVACLFATTSAFAQAPAAAPAGSTGSCKDGSFTSAASKRGACAGHKGVADWYAGAAPTAAPAAAAKAAPATPASAAAAPAAPAPAATPATPAAAAPAAAATPATRTAKTTSLSTMAPAAGGGPGQVWVNTSSHVYHCSTDRYYGKTKAGKYLTEAAAKAEGDRAAAGKACS